MCTLISPEGISTKGFKLRIAKTKGYVKTRDLNTAKDLRLLEEDNECMQIKTCEEIYVETKNKAILQVQDYALWDVIENDNSFKSTARTTANADGTSTSMIPGHVTTEEKAQKKNDVKARSMLLMTLTNEHQLTFNQYKDAKTLFEAIQTIFCGNDATRKTQKTLLKQMYENFNAPNTESLDSIFNRIQKIVSQLAILGENISQEDLNLKNFKSLLSEWNTHVVVWRNKSDLDTMSIDDLYDNFKIVKQEVKRTVTSSSNSNSNSSSQNMAFVSSPNSTNEVNTANVQVSTANSPVRTADSPDSTANLSDATVYVFLANQPNGSQLVHKDLEQIHEDDLEEIDLKWQLALLSMRARRGPRNQDNRNRNQDSSRRTVNVEETSSKAMVAINGAGFDWSFMADEEVSINMALMAFSDSEFNKSEFNLATYKRGLASVEEQIVFYKKNEVMFSDQIVVLKRDTSFKDSEINALKSEIEKLKKEKESNQIKIDKFENASKSLDKLIESQISDNIRKGVGFVSYNVVPPPPTGLFAPPTIDLSNSSLEEFQQPEFEGYGPKASKSVYKDTSNEVKKTPDALLGEKLVSEKEKQIVFPTKIEPVKQQEKPARKPVKYAEMYRSQKPRGNQRTWNNLKSQQLGGDFVMYNKTCFVCGSFDHVQTHCNCHQREGMLNGNNYTMVNYNYSAKKAHPKSHKNMTPRAVLMKTGLKPLNTARLVNTAHPKTIVYKARPRPTSAVVNVVRENQVNSVKASACWVWRPTKLNSASITFKRQNYIDARGRSKHYGTCKMVIFIDFKEFMDEYVPFGGGDREEEFTDTMLANYKLPTTFWAEAVNTACYVQNRTSKAFRVYNIRTRKVEENLHIRFLENKPIVTGDGPKWLFDIDSLTKSMNYVLVVAGTNSNDFAGSEESNDAGHTSKETKFSQDYIVMPLWKDGSMFDSSSKNSSDDEPQPSSNVDKKDDEGTRGMTKNTNEHGFISDVYEGKTHEDLYTCLFACFLSQEEPKRISKSLSDPAWGEAMQEELL
ncbi:hypothetical protein Tco_0010078 [Tanacetum coccineum]